MLSEAQARAGQLEEALATIEQAFILRNIVAIYIGGLSVMRKNSLAVEKTYAASAQISRAISIFQRLFGRRFVQLG